MQRFTKNIRRSKWLISETFSKAYNNNNIYKKVVYKFSESSIPNNKSSR